METILFGSSLRACQNPAGQVDTYGVFTNTTPTDAYRGAGRPEATYLIERMVDLFAEEIGMDPVEIRRRNLIEKDEFPYDNALRNTVHSGDYKGALDKVLNMLDYDKFQEEQNGHGSRASTSVSAFPRMSKICGLGPSKVAGAVGFQGDCGKVRPSAFTRQGKCPSSRGLLPTARVRKRRLPKSWLTSSASRRKISK